MPGIGSVCSGGRYDNLAGLFTSQKLPGVGASLGLDRLLAAMEELGAVTMASTPAPVLAGPALRRGPIRAITCESPASCARQASKPKSLSDPRAIGKQLAYANRKGFRVALIAGETEFAQGAWQVKDLKAGQQTTVPEAGLPEAIRQILA